jgi:hypothetical protein
MKFEDWNAKTVEGRILEMAEALRLSPAARGPQSFGSAMPEAVRVPGEGYGYGAAYYRKTVSAGALGRMEQVWAWINALPEQSDRKLIYAWSWVKVRKGMKISAFAEENDLNERTLRRAVTAVCQRIANNLNRNHAIRLDSADLQVSENQPDITSQTVTSESCVTHWRGEGAKPQLDPAHARRWVIDHREIRAR